MNDQSSGEQTPRQDHGDQSTPNSGTGDRNLKDAECREHRLSPDRKAELALVALVAVATTVYAVFSVGLWRETAELARQGRQQFARDQRPYVWLADPQRETLTIVAKKHVAWNVAIKNYGKSPALNVRIAGAIFTGDDVRGKTERFFAMLPRQLFDLKADSVLLPTAEMYFTLTPVTEEPIDDVSYNYILGGSDRLRAVGRIEYQDMAGQGPYHSDFCFMRLVTGAIAACETNNQIR